jgi:L-histidine N-alpha-methyltransferase
VTRLTIESHLTDADVSAALRNDVVRGLTASPKELPPKWFYDERGSALFEQITELPEYYPTRTERAILRAHAAEVAKHADAATLVELGSGSSEKTRLLLDAMTDHGGLERYVPVDVSSSALTAAADALHGDYPGLEVHGVVADFERHLEHLPVGGRRLIAFLGGTIGNFAPEPRARFLARIRAGMRPGDSLLLGTDLVKNTDRLVRAYDDAAGVTAEFNRNVLRVINRELDADFDPPAFAHVARWDPEEEWIEMRLRAAEAQQVRVAALDLTVDFTAGEEMRTEISAKFRPLRVKTELRSAGLAIAGWWTDDAEDFAVSLSQPV